jgi:predicted RNase H-like HicB family nuclease
MLTKYIEAAMRRAHYELIGDGTYFGTIEGFDGVWGNAPSLEECRDELQSTLEDWLLLKLWLQDTDFPVVGRLTIKPPKLLNRRGSDNQARARKAS